MAKDDKWIYREIGARIKAARKALKMTQAEVAERVGIDPSFFGQVERGANIPSIKTLFAVAATVRVEPADLLPTLHPAKPGRPKDTSATALSSVLSSLKPRKRHVLMSVVRDLADELK